MMCSLIIIFSIQLKDTVIVVIVWLLDNQSEHIIGPGDFRSAPK
jgi:hypothetical protein